MKALIVGGTGPSGPFLANGLIERGYQVTIFHRGTHEIPRLCRKSRISTAIPFPRDDRGRARRPHLRRSHRDLRTYPLRRGGAGRKNPVLYCNRRSAQLSRPRRPISEFSDRTEGASSGRCAIGDERTGATFLLADQEYRRCRSERPPERCGLSLSICVWAVSACAARVVHHPADSRQAAHDFTAGRRTFVDDPWLCYLAPLENRATNSTRVEGTARW